MLSDHSAPALPYKSPGRRDFFARLIPYAVITLLTVLFYFPLVLPGMGNVREGDFYRYFVPLRIYTSIQLHAGSIPFRSNSILGGHPLFQEPPFALLYPVNLLFGLLVSNANSEAAIDLYMLLNLLVLSLSAVFFVRSAGLSRLASLAGASIISFTGFTVTHSVYIDMPQVQAMSLIGAGFLMRYGRGRASDFRLVLLAAVALAMGNIAGHPQTTVYYNYAISAGVAVMAFRLWQKTGRFSIGLRMAVGGILAFVFGILLSAVQLVPSGYLMSICARAVITRAEALWTPIHWPQLSMFLFPGFYQTLPWHLEWPPYYYNPGPGATHAVFSFTNLTEGYIPMGVFATVLGLIGWFHHRRSWPVQVLGWGSLFLIGCCMGDALPLYGWLCDFVPGFSLVRVSTRILIVFYPAWAILAGLGIEAIWRQETGILKVARWSLALLLLLVTTWVAWVLSGYHGSGTDMWIRTFIPYIRETVDPNLLHNAKAEVTAALIPQVILGVLFVAAALVLFGTRSRRPRARTTIILFLMAAELVLYGFGWNMAINTTPIESGRSGELDSFPRPVNGRAVVGNLAYGGIMNAALYSDVTLANGYSITMDKWVAGMLPQGNPQWPLKIQGVLCDLWNVSDICFPKNAVHATVGGFTPELGDWGWTVIGRRPDPTAKIPLDMMRAEMPTSITLAFKTGQAIKALHILGMSGESGAMPDGTEIGLVVVHTTDPSLDTTAPVILGKHFSDPRHPLPNEPHAAPLAHSLAPVAYKRNIPGDWANGALVYDADLDVATSAPVVSLEFIATAPWPATFAVTYMGALPADGRPIIQEAFETEGFKKSESRKPLLYTVRRDNTAGYVRVVPKAIGGSYKKIEYMLYRLAEGSDDPLKSVIVDKKIFDEAALKSLNATSPGTFKSTATITWQGEEHAIVRAETNQPGWLFLSYTWDAGWSATLNGKPVKIYRGSGAFMTIPIQPGKSEIVMRYRPQGLLLGSAISAATLAAMLGAWIVTTRRRLT